MAKIKYQLRCPECGTKFDVSKQLNKWKEELFLKIEKFIKKEIKHTK